MAQQGAEQSAPQERTQPERTRPSSRQLDDVMLQRLRMSALIERAQELRPRRRDEPLRYENISDIEVREIQDVAAKFVAKAIVNISPVVTGCPCEEGPQCTDQVYIVASNPADSLGLQLSRVKNSWQVGVVQRWWLRYDALRARRGTMDWPAYEALQAELLRELPQCVGELVPAASASNTAEVKK
jgi:hypothetical protein